MGLRDQILSSQDRPAEKLSIAEWGCDVWIRTMSGKERDALEAESLAKRGKNAQANMDNFRSRLAVRCVVDEAGVRVFTDDDADALGEKSASALGRIYDVAARLNGYTGKDVEELAKN
jgi:hypothetical protein